MYNMNNLGLAIIERAVHDYRLLKNLRLDSVMVDDLQEITKTEIEDFFRSEWCDFLLQNMKLTGEDILRYLNRE